MERPQVLLNCATSQDGRLAAADGSPVTFSDAEDLRRVHHMRADCDAILVGIGTVLADDPHLTVKMDVADLDADAVRQPVRVVLDAHGRIPTDARILDEAAPSLVLTAKDAAPVAGASQVRVTAHEGLLDLEEVLQALHALGMRSVMVEGGEEVLRAFLASGLWDRFTLYQAPDVLGGDGPRLWDSDLAELGLQGTQEPQGVGTLWTFSPR